MQRNEVNFKALTFISEQTASTFNYEVKGVRALWDPSLSIPGTNRRGGWRCPVGTRYGGQITDRFGRSCGWGVARRIANQIADIGERLENIDDRKRNNRLAKRNARMQRLLARQQKPGLLERGARGIAEALDGGQTPQQRPRIPVQQQRPQIPIRPPQLPVADIDSVPPRPRRRRGNLRESEQRRMDRELVEPGAPRTGEPPKPNQPRRRRRVATQQGAKRTVRRKPEADFVDGAKPVPTVVPRRKPPSAPPKPIVVEPDPNFNAPKPAKPSTPIPDPPTWNPTADDLGGSLPDVRSERNVRNRFREQGLPDTAYWREGAYQGDDNAELERRFGRYYDDNNQRNERGNYVNRRINAGGGKPANRSKPPARPQPKPKKPVVPQAPDARREPPPIRRVLDLDGEFNQPEDQLYKDIVNTDLNNFEPNAYNNLRGLTRDQLQARKEQLKREQDQSLDPQFNIQLGFWFQEKNKGESARQASRSMLINAHLNRERNKLEQEAVNMRLLEMDAGIEWRQKLPKQLPVFQAPDAPQVQTPQTPQAPVPAVVSVGSEVIPDGKVVPNSDAGKGDEAPRRYGKEADLQRAVKLLHEDQGNLADIPDGVVIDAVFDGQFKWNNPNGRPMLFTDTAISDALKSGFTQGEGAEFENRRYKFKLVADKNYAAPGPWQVLKVEDKVNGEIWYLKTSTYGKNDALLENIGMRVAQDLEFGNSENHLRVGKLIDGPPINGGQPAPVRWMMMRDVAQWENGVQGQWREASGITSTQAKRINPRDAARILAMDFVLGNSDRHGQNFLMTEQGGRVRLAIIDNGMLFGGRVPDSKMSLQEHASWMQSEADRIVADPSLRGYMNEPANNPFDELEELGYEIQNDRDRNIYRETVRRSFERMRERLDEQFGIERIEANGIKLSDWEKNHLTQIRRVAEARIAWGLANLDRMTGPF